MPMPSADAQNSIMTIALPRGASAHNWMPTEEECGSLRTIFVDNSTAYSAFLPWRLIGNRALRPSPQQGMHRKHLPTGVRWHGVIHFSSCAKTPNQISRLAMLDLAGLTNLFFERSVIVLEPAVVVIPDLTRVEDEPLFQRLYAEGHTLQFADAAQLRDLVWSGWEPVTELDLDGRQVIFTDRRKQLVLMHRSKQQ
jgi:hypothetical protein